MAKEKLPRFKLLDKAAPHFEPNPNFDTSQAESKKNPRDIEYVSGDIVESSDDLVAKFPGKFELVHERKKNKDEEVAEEADPQSEEERLEVTEDFPSAKEVELQVFKSSSGKFFVHEKDGDSPMEGSENGLSRKELEKFLKKQVAAGV